MFQYNISFAGAGRVAGALCREMYHAGHNIGLIVSETEKSGRLLADSCNSQWSPDLIFPDSSNIIIVCVPDHRLKSVLEKMSCGPGALVVHTAGSIGIDIFPVRFLRKGVFYPLQTFSKERKIDFNDLPFFLESSDKQSDAILEKLTESIGSKAHFSDTEHRRMLHVAAVFVCNFTNYMLTAGKDVTFKAGFPFDVLRPLIIETFSKALDNGPENSQTGPAVRNDLNTIGMHLELLSFSPGLKKIYNDLTQSIITHYNK
jgi:predicted short-subunit dehydrogenase-like oxidoreductase (DUF2520 family)